MVGLALGAAATLAAAPADGRKGPAQPRALAAGSWATSEAPAAGPARAHLRLVSAPAGELPARLEAELAPAMVSSDGAPATPRSLAEGKPITGHFLLWVSSPLEGGLQIQEGLKARPVRHELDVALEAGAAAPGAPARRYFGLWHLPADLPLLTARVAVAGSERTRARFLGPRSGHREEGRGWVEAQDHILRAPPAGMPRAIRDAVNPQAPGEPVAWELVAHGDYSGAVRKAGRRVLRDPGTVRREWERIHQGQLAVGPAPRLAPRGEVFVALYQGQLDTARGRRRVVGVWMSDGGLVVGVRSGGAEAAAGDSPYVWVRAQCPSGTRVEVRPM